MRECGSGEGEKERKKRRSKIIFYLDLKLLFLPFLYLSCFSASAAVVALLLDHFGDMRVGLLQSLVCGVRYRIRVVSGTLHHRHNLLSTLLYSYEKALLPAAKDYLLPLLYGRLEGYLNRACYRGCSDITKGLDDTTTLNYTGSYCQHTKRKTRYLNLFYVEGFL